MQADIEELTHRQLVALRFASDAELPELMREVLAGKLATSKDDQAADQEVGRPDWLRA